MGGDSIANSMRRVLFLNGSQDALRLCGNARTTVVHHDFEGTGAMIFFELHYIV